MANLVNLETVSKGFGTRVLLDGVSLGIGRGERIGVVGRNGDGKSTLLAVLSAREPADSGRVTHARDLRLGFLLVLALMAVGMKDEAIARQLGMSPRTLRRRSQELLAELGAGNRFQAGVEAARRGWI